MTCRVPVSSGPVLGYSDIGVTGEGFGAYELPS